LECLYVRLHSSAGRRYFPRPCGICAVITAYDRSAPTYAGCMNSSLCVCVVPSKQGMWPSIGNVARLRSTARPAAPVEVAHSVGVNFVAMIRVTGVVAICMHSKSELVRASAADIEVQRSCMPIHAPSWQSEGQREVPSRCAFPEHLLSPLRGRQPGNAVLTSLDLGSRARIVLSYRGLHNLTPTSILRSYCPFEYPKPRSW
jgi:hypothetical protein